MREGLRLGFFEMDFVLAARVRASWGRARWWHGGDPRQKIVALEPWSRTVAEPRGRDAGQRETPQEPRDALPSP